MEVFISYPAFLQKKKQSSNQTGVIEKSRNDESIPEDSSAAIEACAMELIIAVHTKDIKAVAEALKSAFEVLESQPEEESSPHTFEAQNIIK